MTQQGIPSPFPDAVGYYWVVDQSTAFGFTLRKTEYPAMSWFGLGIPSCVVFFFFMCCRSPIDQKMFLIQMTDDICSRNFLNTRPGERVLKRYAGGQKKNKKKKAMTFEYGCNGSAVQV